MRRFRDFSRSGALTVAAVIAIGVAQPVPADDANRLRSTSRSTGSIARAVPDPATGNLELVRFSTPRSVSGSGSSHVKAIGALSSAGRSFGILDPTEELQWLGSRRDLLGGEQVVFRQVYRGVPVFGTLVRVHFDSDGALSAINGTFVSDIDLDPIPAVDAHVAEKAGAAVISKQTGLDPNRLEIAPAVLTVYRENLVRGLPGGNHLAWEVTVTAPPAIHEVLYLDAADAHLIDQRSEIHHLDRVIHIGSFPRPIWSEGDPRPYTSGSPSRDAEVNELIDATGDIHTLFKNITGGQYLSFDGYDSTMNAVYDAESIDCPNAVESGGITAFCEGMVSDDVTAHEWAHAYTEWTHGLIYQWQPGALNEAYSDIFGELADQLNGRGTDDDGEIRPLGACSAAGGSPRPTLEILSPPSIAGPTPAGGAAFNPPPSWNITAAVTEADDGVGDPMDACQPITGFSPGSIALIRRGSCLFRDKVVNAQNAGAAGVIIVNNQGDDVVEMGGDPSPLDIPAVSVGGSDGARIENALGEGVTATLALDGEFAESVRWLIGEDTEALGPIRDMWAPGCFGDPPRVGSSNYHCNETDNGGVHTNSGIANHAFALLVDGGAYNGQQITAIGATKAARIYWRAMSRYQTPVSGFPDHAELLRVSCEDLIGSTLYDLQTGAVSGEVISMADCDQIDAATAAVEMRAIPEQCRFDTLLDPDAPALPGNLTIFEETFESDPVGRWQLDNFGVFPEYEPRDWQWTDDLPVGGEGSAFFAVDSVLIGDCRPGSDDQSGVMELVSPTIELPPGSSDPVLAFDHWVATEPEWDGGNLKISVNGGPFLEVQTSRFLFNPTNGRITSGTGTSGPNPNPLKGQRAWSGTDQGMLSGSWGQTQIDLEGLVGPGDRVVLRFDFGVDGCNGAVGWYVDNIRLRATGLAPRTPAGRVAP